LGVCAAELFIRKHFLGLIFLEAQRISTTLDKLLPLLKLAVVFSLMNETRLLILIILFFGKHHQCLCDFIHVQLTGPNQFKKDVFCL
jgi:hypothetical protein